MAIRVLILHRQLVFAVTVRQALEQTGRFDAHPFTQADAAFDYLRDHPQDVALVDFTLPGRSGPKIVQQLRAIQPDLAIIITPNQDNGDVLLASLNLQGMIDTPFGAREIIPLLEEAVSQIAQTPTQGTPPYIPQSGPLTDILGTNRLNRPQIELGPLSTRPLPDELDEREQTARLSAPPGQQRPTRPLPVGEGGLTGDRITKLFADMHMPEVNLEDPSTGPISDTGSLLDIVSTEEGPMPTSATDVLLQDVMDASLRQYPTGDLLGNPFTDDDFPTATYEEAPAADIFDQMVTGLLPDEQTGKLTSNPTRILGPDENPDDVYLNTAELNARRYGPTDRLITGPVGPERSRNDEASELRRAFETGPLVEPPRRRTGSIAGTPPPARLPEEEAAELRRAFETGPLVEPPRRGSTDKLGQPEPEMDWLEQIIPGTRNLPPEDPLDSLVTRDLQPGEESPRRRGTTPYRESPPPPPAARTTETEQLPAFNSLDNVVQNFGFDAPLQAEDTPSVPMPAPTDTSQQRRQRPERDFNNLVDSMRPGESRTRLTDRQQATDFIVTGGMDSVLKEIKKTRTSQLPRVTDPEAMPPSLPEEQKRSDDTAAFKRLAAEEPPLPTFEASGTVRDLMVGVSDPAFQNVLSLIQGDAVADTSQMQAINPSAVDDINTAFNTFAEPTELTAEPTLRPALRLIDDYNFGFDDDESGGTSIAQAVLEGSARFSDRPVTSGDVVDQLMQDIQNRLSFYALAVKPLPSWGMETGAFRPVGIDTIREPDFLPEQFEDTGRTRVASGIRVEPPVADEFNELAPGDAIPPAATIPHTVDQINWAESWDAAPQPAAQVYDLPEIEARDEDSVLTPAEVDELPPSVLDINWDVHPEAPPTFAPEVEAPAPVMAAWDTPPSFAPENETPAPDSWEVPGESGILRVPEAALEEATPEDPFLATVALNLTQYSLETNACSTILTRGQEVVAFAGDLTPYDMDALTAEINADWDVSVSDGARIRFVNLQHTGRDYMLYSIRTDGDLTLSLLYDSDVSLRSIRQQAGKLVGALKATPAPALAPAKPASLSTQRMKPIQPAADTYSTYAYLWLLRDPEGELERPVQQAVRAGLTTQLSELFWEIKSLDVHEDYIYLLASVPGEASTHDLMRDLQHRSAQIARAQNPAIQPDELWADGYLALAPGRALQIDEIQGFINFQRMA